MTQIKIFLVTALLTLTACQNNNGGSSSSEKDKAKPPAQPADGFKNETQRKLFSKFITGTEFCKKFSEITSKENGFRVKVPVDYKDLNKGTTEIYAFFAEGIFDSKLPTVINFDGGSGANSHGWPKYLKSFNELHFDQRGIGCSRPESLELYKSPSFYSSENNARDANEIRKHLGLAKVSVWGGSYGTVPATIFGHLFPEATTAVALEGVLFSGETQESSKVVNHLLKKIWPQLPSATKDAMKVYFSAPEMIVSLDLTTRMAMYSNDAVKTLTALLLNYFPSPDKIKKEEADKIFKPGIIQRSFFETDKISTLDQFNNTVLNCKELHVTSMVYTLFGYIKDDKSNTYPMEFVPYKVVDNKESCNALEASPDPVLYSAAHFPISVPVTYFQGNWDGATSAAGAVNHYKKVPKAQKQLLIAVKGGHSPNIKSLMDSDPDRRNAQVQAFEKALLGEIITQDDVKKLNATQNEVKWTSTFKTEPKKD
jgi:proline iminopeptidase